MQLISITVLFISCQTPYKIKRQKLNFQSHFFVFCCCSEDIYTYFGRCFVFKIENILQLFKIKRLFFFLISCCIHSIPTKLNAFTTWNKIVYANTTITHLWYDKPNIHSQIHTHTNKHSLNSDYLNITYTLHITQYTHSHTHTLNKFDFRKSPTF